MRVPTSKERGYVSPRPRRHRWESQKHSGLGQGAFLFWNAEQSGALRMGNRSYWTNRTYGEGNKRRLQRPGKRTTIHNDRLTRDVAPGIAGKQQGGAGE